MNWYLNSRLDEELFGNRAYHNQKFVVILSVNSKIKKKRCKRQTDFSDQFKNVSDII